MLSICGGFAFLREFYFIRWEYLHSTYPVRNNRKIIKKIDDDYVQTKMISYGIVTGLFIFALSPLYFNGTSSVVIIQLIKIILSGFLVFVIYNGILLGIIHCISFDLIKKYIITPKKSDKLYCFMLSTIFVGTYILFCYYACNFFLICVL